MRVFHYVKLAYFQSFSPGSNLVSPEALTASVCPLSAAMCRGDLPSKSNLSTKAPQKNPAQRQVVTATDDHDKIRNKTC